MMLVNCLIVAVIIKVMRIRCASSESVITPIVKINLARATYDLAMIMNRMI